MLDKVRGGQPVFQATIRKPQELNLQLKNLSEVDFQEGTELKQSSKEDLEKLVRGMNEFLKPSNTHLKFEFHDELKEYYIAIVDNTTQEVVKEIPPKKLLDIYAAMTDYLGLLVDKRI